MVCVYIFQWYFTFVSFDGQTGEIISKCPKQSKTVSKVTSSHRRSMKEYIESIFVDFKKVPDRFCLRGFGQRYNYSYDPNIWYFFAQYLFSSPLSFLASLYFATVKASFTFSSMLPCFCFRWLCIAVSPGCQAEKSPTCQQTHQTRLDPRDPPSPQGDKKDPLDYKTQHTNQTRKTHWALQSLESRPTQPIKLT